MSDDTYDSYDDGDFSVSDYDDFDSGAEETNARTETESTEDTVDLVAQLLRGEEVDDDTIADHKSRNPARETMTKDVDGHGRAFRSEGESQPAQDPVPDYDTVIGNEHANKVAQVQQANQQIQSQRQQLQNQYEAGLISWDDLQRGEYQLGMAYGRVYSASQQLEIDKYRLESQRTQAHKYLEKRLGEAWAPANRRATQLTAIKYLEDRGIDKSLISSIEAPEIVCAIMEASESASKISSLKDEVASLKAANRRLKGQRAEGRSRGQRASQAGVTGKHQDDMLAQVADVIRGAKKGGRR